MVCNLHFDCFVLHSVLCPVCYVIVICVYPSLLYFALPVTTFLLFGICVNIPHSPLTQLGAGFTVMDFLGNIFLKFPDIQKYVVRFFAIMFLQ